MRVDRHRHRLRRVLKALGRRCWLAVLVAYEWVLARLGRTPDYGLLTIEIAGELSEDGHDGPLPPWLKKPPTDYLALIGLLRSARDDADLCGVMIRCGHLGASWARIQGLRRSMTALRTAGKKVWVHLDTGGLPEYYLASAADRISVSPAGSLEVVGLAAEAMFFLDALEILGVRAEVVQMGAYKSAAESFTRRGMSEENREMVESLVDDLYGQVVDDVAQGRGLAPAAVRDIIDSGPFLAREALEKGLVDAVEYADETEDAMVREFDGLKTIEHHPYAVRRARAVRRKMLRSASRRLAILHINGTIQAEEGPSPFGRGRGAAADTLTKCLKELRKRDDIEAVVARVTSPGGSGLASDLIWHELVLTATVKPLIVSFGDVAASGGYYVALAGRKIFAEPGTVTGSIGVVAGKAHLRGLYEKLGIHKDIISRGRNATLYSDYAPLGEGERERIRAEAQSFYDDFVGKVCSGRNMSTEQVEAVARGRVWTGRQARARGLVDEFGGVEEACDEARRAMGVAADTPVMVERFPRPQSFWRTALGRRFAGQATLADARILVREVPFRRRDRVWLRLPFALRIR